jgi:hypothetical protein
MTERQRIGHTSNRATKFSQQFRESQRVRITSITTACMACQIPSRMLGHLACRKICVEAPHGGRFHNIWGSSDRRSGDLYVFLSPFQFPPLSDQDSSICETRVSRRPDTCRNLGCEARKQWRYYTMDHIWTRAQGDNIEWSRCEAKIRTRLEKAISMNSVPLQDRNEREEYPDLKELLIVSQNNLS